MSSRRKIKLCFLANPISAHTAKWVNHFCARGYEVHVVSFEDPEGIAPEVFLHKLKTRWKSNLRYFTVSTQLTRIIQSVQPDLVHAHYAAGYGTLGRLARFHPYVLSVWGSDVFEVPARSLVHRLLIEKNLASADHVCSTSHFMANHAGRYYDGPITVTPFGVDCEKFSPRNLYSCAQDECVIGTVRSLEETYGVEYLIKSFALLVNRYRYSKKLRLVIVGDGALKDRLQKLAIDCGVAEMTEFLGAVPNEQVPAVLNRLSIFVAVSVFETFGVAVLEASACGLPVVVSDAEGLSEVVQQDKTALIVPGRDEAATAEALSVLIENQRLRQKLGEGGREFVLANYDWFENAIRMERLYESMIEFEKNPGVSLDESVSLHV